MKDVKALFTTVAERLEVLAKANAVVGPMTSVGERHVIPLVELSLGLGGGGGGGEGSDASSDMSGKGVGGGAGGGAKATPIAVVVVDGDTVHLEALGH